MRARIHITLKSGVLDPQGKAIQSSLGALGFTGVENVRQGKYIELDISEDDQAKAHEQLTQMCEKLLANTVIENYIIDLET
ncbi:MAG: phosphoribosylformylglycinamidine synthase subunit PurS [Proteobacteria bacterium]|nr:phosphoribosylformylglycinamidine synthase subunit PurS [Pseudomonadota bacterium]MDA1356286.1 phosphoribosylformylglycinamidine synthase subunit PurS [Pseudomonadota bacterium]